MRLLQSIRFRIVMACVFFSLVVTLCYGWVTFYGVKYNSDELFNWYIAQEAGQLITEYQNKPDLNISSTTTANVMVAQEEMVLSHLASYFNRAENKNKFSAVKSLANVKMPGPTFTTPQGYIIYEFSAENKTIHVLKSDLNSEGESNENNFYYIVDVSDFVNYDNHSEQYIAYLFFRILLVIMILALVIGFVLAKMVVSPLTRLANSVDVRNYQHYVKNNEKYFNDEIGFLAKRIDSFVTRSNDFVEREKAFSRDVSHELRTPVASSRAAVELALSTPEGQSGKLNQFLLRISRANKDMTHLIETFLILGREEQQHIPKESFNLHELVNTSFDKHDYLKRNADIECVNAVAPNYNIMCSKQYLAIIIDNLVRNALQHTNHGTVTVLFENNQVIVQDTGAGIDDSCAQEPSHNVLDKSGVGLSIVKRLSDKQGWQVHVKSKLGEGTNVFVDI